jgi:hypothetical protein
MPKWLSRVLARIHRLAAEGKVQFTAKAAEELKASALGLDERDAADVVHGLEARDSAGRMFSSETHEWLYVFKPWILGTAIYVKLALRADCVVVSFHKEQANDDEDEEAPSGRAT